MFKFNPVYRVTIYRANKEDATVITLPLTASMTITRSILSNNTSANISIYNLAQTTREEIYQPPFQAYAENAEFITVEAGYGDYNSMYMIFKGRVMQAYSTKQGGGVDVVTVIEAQPFDIYSSYSSHTFKAGTSKREAYKVLAQDMPNCTLVNTGNIEGTFKTDTTFQGNTLEQINKITGGGTFIDNGQINSLLSNEVIDVPVPVITDSNALLETPKRNSANLTIKTLFEPSIIVGQLLEVHSGIEPKYDGQYKILGFEHNLYFSSSTEGQRTTTIELWNTSLLENTPIYVSGDKVQEQANKVKGEDVQPVTPTVKNTNWVMPCKGRISSGYGKRKPPTPGASTYHNGIDIAVPIGTPVKAVADGKVVAVGKASGYGQWVVLEHKVNGKIVTSEYGHISKWTVNLGQVVSQGQTIALSGNRGTSSGPHCHLTIREGKLGKGKAVNPYTYIKK